MSREIKFRAWDKEKNHMVDDVVYIDFRAKQVGFHRTGYGSYAQPFENIIFLEYTGLNDKNGKEIYEGDVLKDAEGISVVIFEHGMFKAKYASESQSLAKHLLFWQSEVIGNIYENKELLKAGGAG